MFLSVITVKWKGPLIGQDMSRDLNTGPWLDYCLLPKLLSSGLFLDILREQNYDHVCVFEADYRTGVKNNLKSKKIRACFMCPLDYLTCVYQDPISAL